MRVLQQRLSTQWMRRWLVGALLLAASGMAQAVCTTGNSNVSLGTTTSLALQTTAIGNYGAAGISCTGGLNLLSGAYLRLMLDTANMNLTNGPYSIPFTVSTTQGGTALQNGVTATVTGLTVLSIGGGSNAIALYFNVPLGPNVQAGTYTGTVSFRWFYAICDSGILGACNWDRSPGLVQNCAPVLGIIFCNDPINWGTGTLTSATLTLVVTKACVIGAGNIDVDFGTKALISQFTKVVQTVTVTCTNNEGFTVAFDNGTRYQAPWRRMQSGANFMNYNLYQPNTTVIWNAAQPMSFMGTGVGQTFTFDATVDPTQANLPVGTYTDNVIMTLNY